MKTRNGFVSNSSSSSFCIVGIENTRIIEKLMAADGFTENDAGYGVAGTGKSDFVYYGHGYSKHGDGVDYHLEYGYAGLEAVDTLNTMTLPEAKRYLKLKLKQMNINVDVKDIDLHYGSMSSE